MSVIERLLRREGTDGAVIGDLVISPMRRRATCATVSCRSSR